jgi:hypothetical protein
MQGQPTRRAGDDARPAGSNLRRPGGTAIPPTPPRTRRLLATAAAIALSAVLPACASAGPGRAGEPLGEVFPDPALAACVAAAAGLPDATAETADADLAAVEQLHCAGGTAGEVIRSLAGVEELTSLSVLDVPHNQITDLTPLASLPRLGTLTLTANAVHDLTPLAGLGLFDLGLSQNPVSDLTPLAGTTTLSALGVAAARVTDIGPLAGHDALRELDLSGNAITDVSPLAGLPNLDTLRLARNQIADPTPLGTIPTLLVLDVFGNRIADVGGLAGAPLLQELQLGANPVIDLTPLLAVGTLVNLGLDETDSTRLTGVDRLRAAGVSVNGLA